ncbi:hypothetical protein D9757_006577 [Collybiopsis confluens]|uniref:DUF7143 domain-containing protein n=1 Tax=Collybiopsis confluens TaxID=2823264 RepID=A0A8H5HQ37_9AGAR|nr:hypothetical protein D9757_006577 [Collybiopsis confluens]
MIHTVSVSVLFAAAALFSSAFSAPVLKRANPCFVTGSVTLPAEVSDGLAALEAAPVTCNAAAQVAPGVPDVTSGGITYSTIDFQKSALSPVGFSLRVSNGDLTTLQNQLNDYLALEAGVRSQPNSSALLAKLKGPKFFLQFQIARVNTANGVQLDAADTVDHQLTKVLANAVGATSGEIAQVNALATQV